MRCAKRCRMVDKKLAAVVIKQREAEPYFLQEDNYKKQACYFYKR